MATARTQTTRPPAPAPVQRPASPKPAAATPARAPAGPPAVRLGGAKAPTADVAPGVLELKGMTDFTPPEPFAEFLDAHKTSTVNARFGNVAEGPLQVRTAKKGKYQIKRQPLSLIHPAFARVAEFAPGLAPALFIGVEGKKITGEVGLAAGEKFETISHHFQKTPEILGLTGFTIGSLSKITNTIEGGSLHFGLTGVPIKLGSAFSGTFSFEVIDTAVTFDGNAAVVVKGLANGTLELKRAADGSITGKAAIALMLPSNFSGSVDVAWDGVTVSGLGKVGYKGEKFSGQVTLMLMEKNQAQQLAQAKTAPEGTEPKPAAAASTKKPAKIDYVVFGEGDLSFTFTEWLYGTAHVIADPKGNITVIGEIRPQKEFYPFGKDPKEWNKELFKLEARATYGLPVVADVFIYAKASMDLFAKLGPVKFYNIVIDGTYSTDPKVANNFTIRGSLNISAVAGARLRAEAGVGIEILSHDIKAGAGINGIAGVKAYAEATPIVGYREKGVEGQDLKGEWFIRGELEVAAQPFLGLSGDLFVELETPWWSPLSDDKWTWPLFNKEWPLGGTMGMLVSVDYIFGSGQWPKFDFKPVEFDKDKFMTAMYDDKAKSGSGKDAEQKGKWAEKNSAAAQPPPKASPPGNAKPGKASPLSPAKSKKVAGKKSGKPADPNARTKGGKSVKQLQDQAAKKGKKPAGKDVAKGAKSDATKKDTGKETHDEELKKGLAALDAVSARYAKDGATKDQVITGVKAVRRKFKVFESIDVIDGGATWDYDYTASPGNKKGGPRQSIGNVIPEARRATFRLVAKVSVEQGFDPTQMTSLTRPEPLAGTTAQYGPGHMASKSGIAVLSSDPRGPRMQGPTAPRIHLESWNNYEKKRRFDSTSHGESQMAAWLNGQKWLDQITHIRVDNYHFNPCEVCGGVLIHLLDNINKARKEAGKPLVRGELTWNPDHPWVNELATQGIPGTYEAAIKRIRDTISKMNEEKNGWTVTPSDVSKVGAQKLYEALRHEH